MFTVQSTKYPANITETNGINDSAIFFCPLQKGNERWTKSFANGYLC